MYLSAARNQGADVHMVTELITSLLGLIVFPFAEIKRSGSKVFRKYKLDDLSDKGWPDWLLERYAVLLLEHSTFASLKSDHILMVDGFFAPTNNEDYCIHGDGCNHPGTA